MGPSNYIRYCLDYHNITQSFLLRASMRDGVWLNKDRLELSELLNSDMNSGSRLMLRLPLYDLQGEPANLPPEEQVRHEEERRLAGRISEVANRSRDGTAVQQLQIHFGIFDVEFPACAQDESGSPPPGQPPAKGQLEKFPLFSLPVTIQIEERRIHLAVAIPEVQVHVASLEMVLGDSFGSLIEEVREWKRRDRFRLPVSDITVILDTWQMVQDHLARAGTHFDTNSFQMEEPLLALRARPYSFVPADLRWLSKREDKDLPGSSLDAWFSGASAETGGSIQTKTEAFFPFQSTPDQLQTLTLLPHRAAWIQAPPGDDKAAMIANLLCHLAAQRQRVLLVSRKETDLRLVKDRLKTLGVDFLFGYVPGASSDAWTEEERKETGMMMSRLEPHLKALEEHPPEAVEPATAPANGETPQPGTMAQTLRNHLDARLVQEVTRDPGLRPLAAQFSTVFSQSRTTELAFDSLRDSLDQVLCALRLIPIWLMELDAASRRIPLEKHFFDSVMLDEADQCSIASVLPSMFLSNHMLFIGDPHQPRTSLIVGKTQIFEELAQLYEVPDNLKVMPGQTGAQSVVDLARRNGFPHVAVSLPPS